MAITVRRVRDKLSSLPRSPLKPKVTKTTSHSPSLSGGGSSSFGDERASTQPMADRMKPQPNVLMESTKTTKSHNSSSNQIKLKLSQSKVRSLKSSLQRAMASSPSNQDDGRSLPAQIGDNENTLATELCASQLVDTTADQHVLHSSDVSDDDQLELRTPVLRYGHKYRAHSSDSMTESDAELPQRPPIRRTARVIESDDSEMEDTFQRKKRESMRRRTTGLCFDPFYIW